MSGKRRGEGPSELELHLSELERVLSWVVELDELVRGDGARAKALTEAGHAAREALARLSFASPVTAAGVQRKSEDEPCDHAHHRPSFDAEQACGLDTNEIASRWPPFEGRCDRCGVWVLLYASNTHEVLARW